MFKSTLWAVSGMSAEENKAIVRRFYEEVVNKSNLRLAEELIASNYIEHSAPPGLAPGLEGFKQFLTMIGTAFPDIHVTVEDLIAERDRVAARLTIRGTHKGKLMGTILATGKQATWTGIDIVRIAGGKIIERWSERDLLSLMQQLGAVPKMG